MNCEEIPNLDIFNLSFEELNDLRFVVGESGVQGLITFETLLPFLDEELTPTGFTFDSYYDGVAPNGWLVCDGSTFSATQYPDLFILLGSNVLPDFRGRLSQGTIEDNTVGDVKGELFTNITDAQVPNHTHTYLDTVGILDPAEGDHAEKSAEGGSIPQPRSVTISEVKQTETVGDGVPLANIQPTIVVNKFIKT